MKAQFWSFDLIFAMILFSFTMVILVVVWSAINGQLSLSGGSNLQIMQLQAQGLAQRVLTAGSPANWNSQVSAGDASTWSNVSAGLTQSAGVLSPAKVLALESMANANYQATKPLLGVGFDYFISITGSGTDIGIGLNPAAGSASTIQSVTETAALNGEPVTVTVELWTNSSLGTG